MIGMPQFLALGDLEKKTMFEIRLDRKLWACGIKNEHFWKINNILPLECSNDDMLLLLFWVASIPFQFNVCCLIHNLIEAVHIFSSCFHVCTAPSKIEQKSFGILFIMIICAFGHDEFNL